MSLFASHSRIELLPKTRVFCHILIDQWAFFVGFGVKGVVFYVVEHKMEPKIGVNWRLEGYWGSFGVGILCRIFQYFGIFRNS